MFCQYVKFTARSAKTPIEKWFSVEDITNFDSNKTEKQEKSKIKIKTDFWKKLLIRVAWLPYGRVAYWLATWAQKLKVFRSKLASSYVQR